MCMYAANMLGSPFYGRRQHLEIYIRRHMTVMLSSDLLRIIKAFDLAHEY